MSQHALVLTITRWKSRPKHYYGTVRDKQGNVVQEVLQCATRQRVIEIAEEWANGRTLEVKEGTQYF